jgi:hypothetical protein
MLKAIAQLNQYPKQAFGRTLFLLSTVEQTWYRARGIELLGAVKVSN